MFISRRKYELNLQEAAEKARFELEKEFWLRDRCNGLQEQIDDLRKQVRELKGLNEGACNNEAQAPLPY